MLKGIVERKNPRERENVPEPKTSANAVEEALGETPWI